MMFHNFASPIDGYSVYFLCFVAMNKSAINVVVHKTLYPDTFISVE